MTTSTTDQLLKTIGGRPLLIWGARMTGIGFLRFANKHHLKAIGFMDSDPSLENLNMGGLEIFKPDRLSALRKRHKDLVVMIAVSIKEDEIADVLRKNGMTENDFIAYSKYCRSFFTIDVAGACNLKCPSCAHSMKGVNNPEGFMSLEDFKKIIDKMQREVGLVSHISLYSWGEPFLHPELHTIIDHGHAMGIAMAVSTNLSIRSAAQMEKIVKSSPDYLKISLSGYYPDVYNTTHTGGDVNLVKSNLYRLRYLMDKYGASIFVEVNYHMYKNNIGKNRGKMKELCDELGFAFAGCYANVTPIERLIDYKENRMDDQTLYLMDLLLVDIDRGLEVTKTHRHLPCRFLTNQVNINWDRSVPLCCVCYDRNRSIILSEDYLSESLGRIMEKKENHPFCKKCIKYGFPPYLLGVNQKAWEKEAGRHDRDVEPL